MPQLYHVWQQDEDVDEEPDLVVQAFQQVRFGFQILRILKDNNGRVRERVEEFRDESFWNRCELLSSVDIFVLIVGYLHEAEAEDMAVEEAMAETALKPVPATKESIQALHKVKLGDIPRVSCERCVICLEELSLHEAMDLTSIPCSHLFHENCIVKWLNTSHLCPLCRFPMPINANDQ
ncbi:hypothetical protein CRYUN_Cryun14cG0076600 [Craigia yunnanensis]